MTAKRADGWLSRVTGLTREDPATLTPNPRNFRRHPAAQKAALLGAIADVGYLVPVIRNDRTGHLLDGHERVEEALATGQTEIDVIHVDLPEELEAEALLTLDPIAAMAIADKAALDALLRDVQTGDANLHAMLADMAEREGLQYGAPQDSPPDPGADLDRAEELRQKWGTERGQLWQIGPHRLLCGDSTDPADIARLMGGQKARLFATDPPYGISYDSAELHRNGSHYDAIQSDDLTDVHYQAWLEGCFHAWLPHLEDDTAWYLWHPMLTQGYFAAAAAAAAAADILIHRQIIWVKPQFIFGRGIYHWRHELCFYGWRKGHQPPFYGQHNQTTIWEIGYAGERNQRDHPTAKPPELWKAPMENHLKAGEICAEPFSGSGAQIVAGEQFGRVVYAMEMEPKYVAVALERLAGMGLEPSLT